MDALTQKKLAEAKQHIADADKSMKTSLFKRKPDLDSAADSYQKAASCYKVAKDINQAIQCYTKAAELFTQNDSGYNAAKQYEQVAFLANDLKNYSLVCESFDKSAELMIITGTRDGAGIMLERGANMLKLAAPERALKLLKRAIQIAEIEDKHMDLMTFYDSACALAIRIKDYNDALELLNKLLEILERVGSQEQIIKCVLSVIIIHFSRDDWVCAKFYWDQMKSKYQMSNNRIEELLVAYDEKDDEKFKEILKNYLSYAVDNEVLKMAQAVVKSEDWLKATTAHTRPIAQNPTPVPYQTFVQPENVSVVIPNKPAPVAVQHEHENGEGELESESIYENKNEATVASAIQASVKTKSADEEEEEEELDLL